MQDRYRGFSPHRSGWTIDRIPADSSSIDARTFFAKYVSTRTPVILCGHLSDAEWRQSPLWKSFDDDRSSNRGLDALLQAAGGGDTRVEIETRRPGGSFGTGRQRQTMRLDDFIAAVKNGDSSLYLSTQYSATSTGNQFWCTYLDAALADVYMLADLDHGEYPNIYHAFTDFCKPPLQALLPDLPLRPKLIPSLIPQQLNLWMGAAPPEGVSSGLHHDFADNIYILLQGEKKITLISPNHAPNLHLYGEKNLQMVHENGMITYDPSVGADGSFAADVARWHLKVALKELKMGLKQSERGEDVDLEALRKDVQEAKEYLDLIEEEENDSALDQDDDSDDQDEEEDDDDEEPLFGPGDINDDEDDQDINAMDIQDDYVDENDIEDSEDAPPMNFSKISAEELHSKTPSAKFPNLHEIPKTTFTLRAGEMLYLPASWFHEIQSLPSSETTHSTTGPHVALNYWFHPPTNLTPTSSAKTFESPYKNDFWLDNWNTLESLLKSPNKDKRQEENKGNEINGEDEVTDFESLPVNLKLAFTNPGRWFMSRKGRFVGVCENATRFQK